MVRLIVVSLLSLKCALALSPSTLRSRRGTDDEAFVNPTLAGGSLLDQAPNTGTPPLGEPLNVIISGLSSPEVLTDDGFIQFANAVGL